MQFKVRKLLKPTQNWPNPLDSKRNNLSTMAESKADAEALIPQFRFERLLNQGASTRAGEYRH
jgi:hypothetical protein